MKQIILDQIKRRWLIWAALCLVQFICGLIIPMAEQDSWSSLFPFFPLLMTAFIMGPGLWLSELQQGYARVALTLPFTAGQIGRMFWWLSVGLTTLLFAVFSLLGAITATLASGTKAFGFKYWLLYVVGNSVGFGTAFWFSSGTPSGMSNRLQKIIGAQALPACLFVGGYFLVKSHLDISVKFGISFLVCIFLTILGWFRAEQMIVASGEYRPASQQPKKVQRQFTPRAGQGGIPLIFQTNFVQVWGFGLLLLIVSNLIWFYISHQFDWHHLTKHLMSSGLFIWAFIFTSRLSPLIYNLRYLRTLPIATGRLGAVLLGELILPWLTLFLAITALAWHETGSAVYLSYFKVEFLGTVTVSIFIAVFIWNTQANFIRVVLLIALVLGTFVPAIYEIMYGMDNGGKNGLSWGFVAAFTIVMLAGSVWATGQILARSSSAYRVRQNALANQRNWSR